MRILIYEPLPDINRAPIIAQLAKALITAEHDVLVVIEEELIYTLLGRLTYQGVINCSLTWRRYIGCHSSIKVYKLKIPAYLYWFVNTRNFKERLKKVSDLRQQQYTSLLRSFAPETIFVWNGQHEHLQDFMGLAKQSHQDKFIYMECGWFPQKGTIYFDTSGVNAASSIAQLGSRTLTSEETQKLESWLKRYKGSTTQKQIAKFVFVPLQVDTDTNITLHSPFESMQDLIDFLESWIPADYSVVLRPHPLSRRSSEIKVRKQNFTIDSDADLDQLICSAEFVVGINSTVLLEALTRNKKVIALGEGFLKPTSTSVPFKQSTINHLTNQGHLLLELIERQQHCNSINPKRILHG